MMRRVVSLLVLTVMLLTFLLPILSSCGNGELPEAPEGVVTRVTVDINPSVEFMVDDQNRIISVTALNDDGSILIAGEVFVGLTPEEGAALIVSLANETGYLVSGNVSVDANEVKISVSGDSAYAEALKKQIGDVLTEKLEELDVAGTVAAVDAMKTEALRALAMKTSLYTEEEVNAMSDEELYRVIAAGRIETALLLTEEMREAYYKAKEYEISFAEREETARVIEAMGGIYALVHAGYKAALTAYSESITALDEFRYAMLVSPESEYQKTLTALRERKAELLKQRNYVATLDVNGETYASASVTLQLTEEEYDAAVKAYEELGKSLNAGMEEMISALRKCEDALISLEESFSDDIKSELTANAAEIEANLNAAKDAFFAEFENAHKDDIKALEQELVARKQALIAEIGTKPE